MPPGPAGSENDVIRPLQHDGQTFVVWKDRAEGDAGSGVRYNVYRALEPITEQNLGTALLVAKGVLNNSGKLFGTAFNEAQRIDLTPAAPPYEQPAGMTVIARDAAPLPPWSGLFVHTAEEEACAYYAVVATGLTGEPSERIVPGENATTAPVAEHVEPMKPIKLYDSTKRGIYSPQTEVTGKKGLSLRVLLHASDAQGGGAGGYGDYYLYYANQDMGYVDGMPGVFSVEETHSGPPYLMMRNRDTIVAPSAMVAMYPPEKFGIHRSYPAFSHSSIDDDLGDGSPTSGDLTGGINLGFDWSAVADEPNRWSASITNSLAKAAMTVDVTPRRCQKFTLKPGDAVGFTTSTGTSGTVQADASGLVTVPQVAIAKGAATVLTLTR